VAPEAGKVQIGGLFYTVGVVNRLDDGPRRPPRPGSPGIGGRLRRMHAIELVFAIGWAAFWIYWLVAAFSMKRGRVPWSRELRIRAVIVVLAILLLRLGAFRQNGLNSDPSRASLGLFLFALGLGFAIWARVHIGRNWGTPMSQKDEPELVTSGPYSLVRHPIYSGILVAAVGTAVALSWLWLVAVVLAGIYFVYSATVEERYLTEQFPDSYLVYRRSTKMLLPFIL
jgi:protein-S-isoprenylcysteine O-methyltransferase Ste14